MKSLKLIKPESSLKDDIIAFKKSFSDEQIYGGARLSDRITLKTG